MSRAKETFRIRIISRKGAKAQSLEEIEKENLSEFSLELSAFAPLRDKNPAPNLSFPAQRR